MAKCVSIVSTLDGLLNRLFSSNTSTVMFPIDDNTIKMLKFKHIHFKHFRYLAGEKNFFQGWRFQVNSTAYLIFTKSKKARKSSLYSMNSGINAISTCKRLSINDVHH